MTITKTLTFSRALAADPVRVATALTDPNARMTWSGPDNDTEVVIEGQPTPAPGVRETSTCGPKGNPYVTIQIDWVEITAARISYAETLEAEGEAFATSLAIFDLAPTASGTDLSVTVLVASFAGEEVLPEVSGGWSHAVTALSQYLE